jgi:hypothetical protein
MALSAVQLRLPIVDAAWMFGVLRCHLWSLRARKKLARVRAGFNANGKLLGPRVSFASRLCVRCWRAPGAIATSSCFSAIANRMHHPSSPVCRKSARAIAGRFVHKCANRPLRKLARPKASCRRSPSRNARLFCDWSWDKRNRTIGRIGGNAKRHASSKGGVTASRDVFFSSPARRACSTDALAAFLVVGLRTVRARPPCG